MFSNKQKLTIAALLIVVAAFSVAMPVMAQGDAPPANDPFDWGAIYPALQNLLILLLTGATAAAARWLNAKYHVERGRLTESQIFLLDGFIRTVVFAAEQMRLTKVINSKLDWATFVVQEWCNDHGIAISIAEIRARIEAAVNQEFPKPPSPSPEG